jgi:hypothetical protein
MMASVTIPWEGDTMSEPVTPAVYADRGGELWLDPGNGELLALDEHLLRRLREAWPTQPVNRIEAEFGPLRALAAEQLG